MRVLHLFSNHKWTGPAEPALSLCVQLQALGIQVDYACGPGPDPAKNKVAAMARAWGLPPREGMRLDKHRHPVWNWRDQRTLTRWLRDSSYDVVHCHLDNDHAIALSPARRARIPLVRSSYEGIGFPAGRRYEKLLRDTAWLFEPSTLAADNDAARLPFPRKRMGILPGSVDLARFNPRRHLPGLRSRWAIPEDAFVVGIVARMQTHRHYEDLFDAFLQVVAVQPHARLVVIGRGTRQEEVGHAPVRARGLQDHVVFTGYIEGEDYVAALKMLDAGVFLVPGSDGTCRAVREMLAMGVPVCAADRGMLREIVQHRVTGEVFDGSVAGLARTLVAWGASEALRHELALNARDDATRRFDPVAQAQQVADVYERLVREFRP